MSYTIAITGKGGVGKTTVAGLLVSRLIASGRRPVLAVDADPNTCLDTVLGVRLRQTIGGVREEARQIAGQGLSAGISKQQLLELKIAESLVEAQDFDFLAMGRPEGPGCYCYANNVLRAALGQIAHEYPWVVIDNEAGLENLSRRLAPRVDLLLMVADPSRRGLETLRRLHGLAREMAVEYGRLVLAVNRVRRDPPGELSALQAETGASDVLILPEDAAAADLAERGGPISELPAENALVRQVDAFLASLPRASRLQATQSTQSILPQPTEP
jgi:CO dehydrogenase maturation factor